MKDYYKILQIHPEASLEVMNNAYRTLVRQYHPDLYHSQRKERMNAKMQEINEAYQVLSNPTSRADYDRRYRSAAQNTAPLPRATSWQAAITRTLLWGIGTYIALKFLLLPFLTNPLLKILMLVGMAYLFFRMYSRKKPQPPQP